MGVYREFGALETKWPLFVSFFDHFVLRRYIQGVQPCVAVLRMDVERVRLYRLRLLSLRLYTLQVLNKHALDARIRCRDVVLQ